MPPEALRIKGKGCVVINIMMMAGEVGFRSTAAGRRFVAAGLDRTLWDERCNICG